jgi:hypothetical protein
MVIWAFVRWCSMIAMAIETLAGRLEHDEKQWLLSRGDGEPSSVHRRVRPRSLDPPKKNVARPSRQSFRRTIGVLSVLETNAASVSTIVRRSSYYHGYHTYELDENRPWYLQESCIQERKIHREKESENLSPHNIAITTMPQPQMHNTDCLLLPLTSDISIPSKYIHSIFKALLIYIINYAPLKFQLKTMKIEWDMLSFPLLRRKITSTQQPSTSKLISSPPTDIITGYLDRCLVILWTTLP